MRSIFDFKHINTTLTVPDSESIVDVYTSGGFLYVRVFNGDTLVSHLDIPVCELIDIELITKQLSGMIQ